MQDLIVLIIISKKVFQFQLKHRKLLKESSDDYDGPHNY